MEKNKVYSFEGDPCKIIKVDGDYVTALVLMKTQATVTATMIETHANALEPWHCPYAEDKDIKRVYCENGICQYPMPESAPFSALTGMCMRCLMKSFEEAENEADN